MREWLRLARVVLLVVWPLSAWAAGANLGATLGSVTLADWVWLAILSGVSGSFALLHRVRRNFAAIAMAAAAGRDVDPEGRVLIGWRLFAAAHMTGAFFIGLVAFLIGEWLDINNYLEAAGIALASWSGAALADRWAGAFGDRITAVINSKGSGA